MTFNGDKTEKKEFRYSKNPIAIDYVDINEIIISDVFAYGNIKKLMLSFSFDTGIKKIKSLCINLTKMDRYVNSFKQSKCMSFEIKKNELLEIYHEIWIR